MEDNLAPVVVFAYNRPIHLKNLLEKLNKLKEAYLTELYVYSDGFKVENDINVSSVRDYLEKFKKISHFKKTYIIKSEVNKGLARSIIDGVTTIINKHGRAIVLEDDLEVSSDFLSYMNRALDYYKSNLNIWSISAYTFPMQSLKNYKHDVYLSGRGCSWGWATWNNRWNTVDWEVKQYNHYKFNFFKRHKFASWGRDLPCMLDAYMFGEIHSWAIRWCFSAFVQNKYTIYPVSSRIINKGTDGSGTNYNKSENSTFNTYISNNTTCVFGNIKIDKSIQKEFSKKYLTFKESIIIGLRWILIKLGLLKAHVKNT